MKRKNKIYERSRFGRKRVKIYYGDLEHSDDSGQCTTGLCEDIAIRGYINNHQHIQF